eukprot:GHVQ01040989.1.p1 GENE.GHVQ01040989.1~~GHVQ01040989.1.p1  ORF type:complete len:605 (+),score=53.01 GHVQ01040989.1:62-1876(+)
MVSGDSPVAGLSSGLAFLPITIAIISGAACLIWYFSRNKQFASSNALPYSKQAGYDTKQACAAPRSETSGPSSGDESNWDPLFIYFGSQTGTAECFAKELLEESEAYGLRDVTVVDLEDFDPEEFVQQTWVVFIVATYGEGEPTDNAVQANKWLSSKERDTGSLSTMNFSLFGLGNRQYSQYNEMAKRVERHMKRLGATEFCIRGEGDDDQDIEADFACWKKLFWPAFNSARSGEKVSRRVQEQQDFNEASPQRTKSSSIQRWKGSKHASLDVVTNDKNVWASVGDVSGSDLHSKMYFHSQRVYLQEARELRQQPILDEGLTTFHLDLDIAATKPLSYTTGDNIDILPQNSIESVTWFSNRIDLKAKNLSLDTFIHFVPREGTENKKRPFPTPCTVFQALSLYCDLESLPHKSILKDMLCFVQDKVERETLDRLLAEENSTHFKHYIKDSRMSLKDFIEIFMASAEFDLGGFLQLAQRQNFRPYTISSSSKEQPSIMSITVSKVQENLPSLSDTLTELAKLGYVPPNSPMLTDSIKCFQRRFFGVCSSFLCGIKSHKDATHARGCDVPDSEGHGFGLYVIPKASSLKLPEDDQLPIIMVATGTG